MIRFTNIRFLLIMLLVQALANPAAAQQARLLSRSRQLLVVVSSNWNDLQGRLYAYKKVKNKWVPAFGNPVVLGSKGLGKGDGLINLEAEGPVKHEGDKKSPAGIFSIGTAFGYAPKKDAGWIKNRYIRAFDTLICVDDTNSVYYNRLVDKDTAKAAFNSFEYMHLKKDYYKWGLFIDHNSDKVVPGDGSCIFMHIWQDNQTGTDGCTAMSEKNMLRILRWINAREQPLLVQMPLAVYKKIRRQYQLPPLPVN